MESIVYCTSLFSELLHPSASDEALPICFSLWPWSLEHFSPSVCTNLMGSLMTVIKVWPFEDGQEGSMYYIMKLPPLNRVRDCCKITHPLNEQVELAWGSLQGEDKMWASRLRMALSLNGLNRPHEGKQAIWQRQLNTCPTISTALTLRPRFPRAWHKNYSP